MDPKFEPTLQNVILRLQQFWADQGCLIWQPYHTEVGAGTMNPATFLRVVGPEDWWVGYVEPSIRPTDSRYGENPNRWGHYFQYQVILKPDPGDPQERYLQSLMALGIDPGQHDIRFVEDNWEQPALGAWGLGWEVWLDGQEITQFTYFQQAGGKTLDPVSVEITYGLERIVLALQDVESFVDIRWNDLVSYGELQLDAEREHSRYTFEAADIERLRVMFDEFEAEANNALERGLIFPAHDYVLKCSHTFNLLDGRGAVGVTERAAIFGRMRELARQVTDGYLQQREAAGFPWKGRWAIDSPKASELDQGIPPEKPADFILEVGTEELPHGDLADALESLEVNVGSLLDDARLDHNGIHVYGTPRRLVIVIDKLAAQQKEQVSIEKGPPTERAFDSDGNPTKAAEGFAHSKGVDIDKLEKQEIDGGSYIVTTVRQEGRPTVEVLEESLPGLLSQLKFGKAMRWNDSGVAFSRPIRWLMALHGPYALAIDYAGVKSNRTTRLMRFSDPEIKIIKDVKDYGKALAKEGIVLDHNQRRETIQRGLDQLAKEAGGVVEDDPDLLDEVTHLVEKPTALLGKFDPSYLELPRAVLVSVMKKHQRYFPVEKDGKLLPYFIAIRNGGEEYHETVTRGNEQVIRARFADAAYFIEKDSTIPFESFVPRLSTLTFEKSLGSMLDKTHRIEKLVDTLAPSFGLKDEELQDVQRAAGLCKADLATQMVVEMTSLQGEIGRIYALKSGERELVAQAVYEHYLPRFAGDAIPQTDAGFQVGLADRLDTLAGLFAAGHKPSGARDPFALRRTAIGLVQMLVERQLRVDLRKALEKSAAVQPLKVTEEHIQACLEFIATRQRTVLLADFAHDAVDAVLAGQGYDPAGAALAAAQLEGWRQREDWDELLQAYARCVRITRELETTYEVKPDLLSDPAEIELHKDLQAQGLTAEEPGSVDELMSKIESLLAPITRFFDDVLVMVDDERVRNNRLGLLQQIASLADGVADLSLLEGF